MLEVGREAATSPLKPIDAVLDDAPLLDAKDIRLVRWMKARYFCTYYDAIKTILPGGVWLKYRDFDHMDDYICEKVLLLAGEDHAMMTKTVGECASRTYNLLYHQHLEPGTPEAFQGYVSALHQMYLMGMSMELKRLGYHMTRIN